MVLSPGIRLGNFEILAPIGAGGMGEVYKAKDTRLDRTVAIKVLSEDLAQNPERKARFEREAKAISQLNHPHICTLYDVGEQDGTDFIVMEYIEGETLAERLKKGALKLDEALDFGIQIADGLDKAHRAGIVHRDLKPGNIMLTKSGTKLLDFGLAKLVETELGSEFSEASTRQRDLTAEHAIVGTLHYMSPEQLERRPVDARTDVFALGAVLYEMVTGRRAFEGESQTRLLSAILSVEPPKVSRLQPAAPPSLDHLIDRALAKDPDERWQTARDLHAAMRWIEEDRRERRRSEGAGERRAKQAAWVVATVIVLVAIGVLRDRWPGDRPYSGEVQRLTMALPSNAYLRGLGSRLALSPDGRNIAYVGIGQGGDRVYLRPLDRLDAMPVPATQGARGLFFSPDSRWLGFNAQGALKIATVSGGEPPLVLLEWDEDPARPVWVSDDTILYGMSDGLYRIHVPNGAPEKLLESPHGLSLRPAALLDDGRAILFGEHGDGDRIVAHSFATGDRRVLTEGSDPWLLPTGHLLFARGSDLYAVSFDPDALALRGEPILVQRSVLVNQDGTAQVGVSETGTLAYLPANVLGSSLLWVERDGREELILETPAHLRSPRLSPDSERAVVDLTQDVGGNWDLWLLELQRRNLMRLTFRGINMSAAWSPDGKRLAHISNRSGSFDIFVSASDGGGEPLQLTSSPYVSAPGPWTPFGDALIVREEHPNTGWDLGVLPTDGVHQPDLLLSSTFDELYPALSPDGSWLAYTSDESGQREVYVTSFPDGKGKTKVSIGGGTAPVWARDGRELYYRDGDSMMAVAVSTAAGFEAGTPQRLFHGVYDYDHLGRTANYDVSRDGRFLMVRVSDQAGPQYPVVVLNWFSELERLIPTN